MTIRVLIADDQELVRAGLSGIIDSESGLTVVAEAEAEAGTGISAVELTRRERPDVVLMDVQMPDMDGIEATRLITGSADTATTRVLILTTFDLDAYVYAALRGGASGFLLKDTPPTDLYNAINVIAAGDALLAPAITRRLIKEFAARPEIVEPPRRTGAVLDTLTKREHDVLRLVAHGMSNTEIAGHLRISPATAKTHVGHLLTKLNARDRVQLVIIAYQTALVVADP